MADKSDFTALIGTVISESGSAYTCNGDEARHFIERFGRPAGARQALEAVWEHWNHSLGAIHVETPDPALDVLANGWLVYQALSCRLWGRSGWCLRLP